MSVGLPFRTGAIILKQRKAKETEVLAALAGFHFGEADMGELRFSICHLGYFVALCFRPVIEKRVGNSHFRLSFGSTGVIRAGNITDSEDFLVARSQTCIDDNSVRSIFNAGDVKVEFFDIRLSAGGDQEMAGFDLFFIVSADDNLDF